MGNKRKILLVEDEPHTRYILQRLLEVNDYEVKSAEDGVEAMEIMKTFTPELIIADWSMPKMDGVQLCQKIKKDSILREIYFILLTAKATLSEKVVGLDTGADDYLTKPAENDELLARIRSGLRIYDLQLELKTIEHTKALIEMATTLGHQMNNPISAINLSLESLKKNIKAKKFEELQEDFQLINEAFERLRELTTKLANLKDPKLMTYIGNSKMLKL